MILRFEIDLEAIAENGGTDTARLTPEEHAYCAARAHPAMHAAARVAAKRAVLRALGLPPEGHWISVEIVHGEHGRPDVRLTGQAAAEAARLGARSILVSLTHTASHAAAAVLLEG